MEFLVEFDVNIPAGTPEPDVEQRVSAEAAAAAGELLYVRSRAVRHGSAEVLARLNKGVFIRVAGRQAASVIYETYLVA